MENENKILVKEKKNKFILNAIEDGWSVSKKKNLYIFTKDRTNELNVMSDDYLKDFIVKYLSK
tara:strand:+ start:199 stop:387 length:189 start_codon:yes stop_codon:yes gene_type:complete